MNWGNLGWILYYAAHTAAGIWSLLELFLLEAVQELGLAAWAFGVLWLALAAAGRTGCPSLQGTVWRIFAAGLLPALCGAVDALWRGDTITPTPAMWAFSSLSFCWQAASCCRAEWRGLAGSRGWPCWNGDGS